MGHILESVIKPMYTDVTNFSEAFKWIVRQLLLYQSNDKLICKQSANGLYCGLPCRMPSQNLEVGGMACFES